MYSGREYEAKFKDKPEYTKYRLNYKGDLNNKIQGRENFRKFAKLFFDVIAEEMLENENGVFIDKLGYFFVWTPPKKYIYVAFGKTMLNAHTDRRMYFPCFKPSASISEWTMDKCFSVPLRQGLAKRLREGKRYKMHLSYVSKKLYK